MDGVPRNYSMTRNKKLATPGLKEESDCCVMKDASRAATIEVIYQKAPSGGALT